MKIFKSLGFWTVILLSPIAYHYRHDIWQTDLIWYCPVCQGQSLFESHHPIAHQVLNEKQLLEEIGLSDAEVAKELEKKYGSLLFAKMPSHIFVPGVLLAIWIYQQLTKKGTS